MRIARVALKGITDEEIQAGARESKRNAPMYLHMATQIASDVMKRDAEENRGAGTTLNVVIVGQAASNEAWLAEVKRHANTIEATAKTVRAPALAEKQKE